MTSSPPNTNAESAAPQPPSPYDELGGAPAITEAVHRFYRRVLDDPQLAGLFAGRDVEALEAHQVALLTKVLGGPDRYGGRALRAAHRGLGISDRQYDAVVDHLVAVLTELGAGEHALSTVAATVAAVRPDIVERPDS